MNEKIHEIEDFKNRNYVLTNRFEAGKILGLMLKPKYDHIEDGIILAIPSGGVPVGIKVKEILGLPLDLMIVRKLQIPGNREAGFGAMTLDGMVFYNKILLAELQLSQAQIDAEKKRVSEELEKRNLLFRGGRPLPDLTGKKVILVDDGLASGFTMLASIAMVKKVKASEIIMAVPTAPQGTIRRVLPEVDEVYIPNIRNTRFFAVAEAYQNWYDLSKEEVLEILNTH